MSRFHWKTRINDSLTKGQLFRSMHQSQPIDGTKSLTRRDECVFSFSHFVSVCYIVHSPSFTFQVQKWPLLSLLHFIEMMGCFSFMPLTQEYCNGFPGCVLAA